ncbi:MAG: hypothetical protein RLZZ299_1146 [Pseudomonadota bacterium]|jgi:hypothetical protein
MILLLLGLSAAAPAHAEAPAAGSGLVGDVIRQVARERAASPLPAPPPAAPGTDGSAGPPAPTASPPARADTRTAPDATHAAPTVPLAGDRATGATLCVHDPQGLAPEALLVDVEGFTGPMRPRDDGVLPDVRAGDGVHSVTLSGWAGGPVRVHVRSGARTWDEEARVAGHNQLWVSLTMMPGAGPLPDGTTVAPPGGDPNAPRHIPDAKPDSATPATPPSPTASGSCTTTSDKAYVSVFQASFFAWMTAGAGLFLGLGLALGRHARTDRGTGRADARPTVLADADALHAWVAANPRRRWVVVGPTPDGLGETVPLVAGVLPEEVYEQAAALALHGGDPIAVLVTDVMAFDAPDERQPEDVLARLLDGRCPLFILNPRT